MKINIVGPGNMGLGHCHPCTCRWPWSVSGPPRRRPCPGTGRRAQAALSGRRVRLGRFAGGSRCHRARTPVDTALQVARSAGAALAGQVLVDICNPIDFSTMDARYTPDSSAAEEIQQILGTDVKVVKAFNAAFAGPLATGKSPQLPARRPRSPETTPRPKTRSPTLSAPARCGRWTWAPSRSARGTGGARVPAYLTSSSPSS